VNAVNGSGTSAVGKETTLQEQYDNDETTKIKTTMTTATTTSTRTRQNLDHEHQFWKQEHASPDMTSLSGKTSTSTTVSPSWSVLPSPWDGTFHCQSRQPHTNDDDTIRDDDNGSESTLQKDNDIFKLQLSTSKSCSSTAGPSSTKSTNQIDKGNSIDDQNLNLITAHKPSTNLHSSIRPTATSTTASDESDDESAAAAAADGDDDDDDDAGDINILNLEKSQDRNEHNDTSDPPLSEYELLRLRNIERNNARLAALGLLHNVTTTNGKNKTKKKKKRKRMNAEGDSKTKLQLAYPVRRSTRNRRNTNGSINSTECNDNDETVTDDNNNTQRHPHTTFLVRDEEAREERYTVSPLFQNDMYIEDSKSHDHPVVGSSALLTSSSLSSLSSATTTATMTYTGTRLLPPKGLGAIYFLSFYQDTPWLVGAGKSGMIALWNSSENGGISHDLRDGSSGGNNDDSHIDPVLSWKAHSGRWIAGAQFLPPPSLGGGISSLSSPSSPPSRLVTAANDGNVCLWDLSTVSESTGAPKLIYRSGKEWHTGGIFSMDVACCCTATPQSEVLVATGSKDKTIVVSSVDTISSSSSSPLSTTPCTTVWRSSFHTAKVGSVQFQPRVGSSLLASASDDGIVAVHDRRSEVTAHQIDYYANQSGGRPHSAVWHPNAEHILATAGLDRHILLWDLRNLSKPWTCLDGHVPLSTTGRCKKIHRPIMWTMNGIDLSAFVLTGGEGSGSMSMYHINPMLPSSTTMTSTKSERSQLLCRGRLPADCDGDVGCIAVSEHHHRGHMTTTINSNRSASVAAVSVDHGEVLLLKLQK
jgi:WD40 repeat protein